MTKLMTNVLTWRVIDPDPVLGDVDHLDLMLEDRPLNPPAKLQVESTGWVKPAGESYGHAAALFTKPGILIAQGIARRVYSKKAIDQAVARKAAEIEKNEDRKVFAREKTRIKEELVDARLPSADIELGATYTIISLPYIFVLTSSVKTAEKLLDDLRASIDGGLKLVPVSAVDTPMRHFTHWFGYGQVQGEDANAWAMGNRFTLHNKSSESEVVKGSWPFQNDETLSDWVSEGSQKVTELELRWQWPETDSVEVSFLCNEMLALKGIKWPAYVTDRAGEHQGEALGEDKGADMLTNVAIAHGALRPMLTSLLGLLGGERLPKTASNELDDVIDRVADAADALVDANDEDGDLI